MRVAEQVEALEALDLNPGVAKIDPSTRKAFVQFKAKQAEEASKQSCAPCPSGMPGAALPSSTVPDHTVSAASQPPTVGLGSCS